MDASDSSTSRKPAGMAGVWIAIAVAISVPIFGHSADRSSSTHGSLPQSYPPTLVADTQIDRWKVTNFIGPFVRVDKGVVPAPDIPGGKAQKVFVPDARANLYDVSLYSVNARPVHGGDRLEAAVWMRLSPTQGNRNSTHVRLLIQNIDKPYAVVADRYVNLTSTWRRYTLHGVAAHDYAPGRLGYTVHMATHRQTIDVGHGQLFDYGT